MKVIGLRSVFQNMTGGKLGGIFAQLSPRQKYSREFWMTLGLFSLLFGLFLSRTTAPYLHAEYAPSSSNAVWIVPPVENAVAYFRREFSIDSLPTRATIDLVAPDGFTIYVNGLKVESLGQSSRAVSTLDDITNYLRRGRNVVAVRVERKTFPGSASLRANIRWIEPNGSARELHTDNSWRIARREELQSGGSLAWYANDFDDSGWALAQPLPEGNGLTASLAHPWAGPDVFLHFPSGEWMRNNQPGASGVGFRREFDLGWLGRREIRNAWLGISATSPYTLMVNGVRATLMPSTDQYMDTYDIGSFLFSGKNTIEIETSNIEGDGRIAVAALITTPASSVDLSSDPNWRTRMGDGGWQPVSLMGGLQTYPYQDNKTGRVYRTPILRLTEIQLPGGLLLRHFLVAIPWMVAVFAITLGLVDLGLTKISAVTPAVITAAKFPLLLANLALVVAYLLPFDIRITEADIFTVPAALGLVMTTLALFFLILIDVRHVSR